MKKIVLIILSVLLSYPGLAQVVVTDPEVPVTNMAVTVTFDATQGNGELAGYTGDVYAHTGVITNLSTLPSDWKYVKTGWGVNTPGTKLTSLGDDIYALEIVPNIRDYYGVPEDEEILKLAFVFRSEEPVGDNYLVGRTESGGDIFIDVLEDGLNIAFFEPQTKPVLIDLNESFLVEVYANMATKVSLFVDDVLIKEVIGNSLQDTITASDYETHWVKAIAEDATASVADSFYFVVPPEVEIAELPAGVRDGINYLDEESVVLALLAPNKEFVYVIGDFNTWQLNNNHYMKQTPDGERFWVEVDGLMPGVEYAFQYFIDGEMRIADPFTDKVLVPTTDAEISEETYPGLKEYPLTKTYGIVSVLQTGQGSYQWEINNFTPAKTTDLVIYEMLIRDYTSEHTYASIADTLDYLERLGVNTLELMPVNEFEGNLSWGYNPSFYFAPDKYYGPKNELKHLIDECHKRGIAVILDIVLNHSYNQSPLVQMYFDGSNPTADNPWYNAQHNFTNPDAHWGNDFNHESIYTQNFIDSVNSYWMSEYRFDGFRFDFTKGFSNTVHGGNDPWGSNYDADRIAILKRMADEIWTRNENAIIILEHLSENSEEKELADYGFLMWGNANYNYAEAAMGYHDNNKSDFSWISYKKRDWNDPHVVGYMESHDEERIMFKNLSWGNTGSWWYNIQDTSRALDRIRLVSTFFYTIPGPKMIWQFGELGYDYSIDYNGRLGEKPVRWDYFDDWRRNYNYHFISALIKLRIGNDAFETGNFILDVSGPMKRIRLYSEEMNVVVVGNFDVTAGEIQPLFIDTGTWYDYFNGTNIEVEDINMALSLAPGEYRIYTDVELETPDINTGIGDNMQPGDTGLNGMVYPNPVSGSANLTFSNTEEEMIQVNVYDLLGSKVLEVAERRFHPGRHSLKLNSHSLTAGIYVCVLSTEHSRYPIKFIRK